MGITQISDPFSLLEKFKQFPPVRRFVIALSGGLDSVVLLHSLCQLRSQLPQQSIAVHIHHGLMPEADQWTQHCADLCQSLGVDLEIRKVEVEQCNIGIEAAARQARYAALAEMMDADSALLTAHHQNDQIETVLLHLVKGAGSAGLAGMPGFKPFSTGWHFRPLLDYPREQLEKYASQYQLDFVQDSSNQDQQFERNYLRHQVVPGLLSRWPGAGSGIARAARHQSDALAAIESQAFEDLQLIQTPSGAVEIESLLKLTRPRQNHVLRYWIRHLGGGDENPSEANIESIRRELIGSTWDSEPQLLLHNTRIYRFRNLLFQEPDTEANQTAPFQQSFQWSLNESFKLDSLGLYFEPSVVLNRFPSLTPDDHLTVRFRQGGEKIKLLASDHHKSLKKLFQSWGVAPWRRQRIPLLYHGEQILIVWGYAVGSDQ